MLKNQNGFSFEELNWQYSLEDLDSFKDLPHLTNLTLQKIKDNIQNSIPYFFVLQQEFHEYREVNREGTFSIPEDSSLITYLAIRNKVILKKNLSEEDFFKEGDEEVLTFLFSDEMQVNALVPIVYRFRLLGFVAISLKKRKLAELTEDEETFLELLRESLRVNLYAAILIDNRFYELLTLVDITKKLENFQYYDEICANVIELAGSIVNFDIGVYYQWEDSKRVLIPVAVKNVASPKRIKEGESVSGYVLQKKKPAIINNIKEHVFFNDINKESFITGSFISIPFVSGEQRFGVLTIAKKKKDEEFSVDHLYLLRIIAAFIADFMETKRLYQQLEKSYFDTVSSLANALEAKDKYTRGHSERVMLYSVGIAEELRLTKDALRDIKFAAVLHDIGKIGISEYIITKPGRLTTDEYQVIQAHPMIGSDILASIAFLTRAKEYVRYHHEKLDGNGYYGKKKGEYPWETEIIVLADSFDALTSDRPYRKAIHPELAIVELKRSVGKQFDQNVFDAMVRYLKKRKTIRESLPV